jgi:hypothetical protein
LCAAPHDTSSKLRIKELVQRLKGFELSLYNIEKQHRNWQYLIAFIGLTPEQLAQASRVPFGRIGPGDVPTIIKLKELREERTRIIRELLQLGFSQPTIEKKCAQIREDNDKAELLQLGIGPDATAEPTAGANAPTITGIAKGSHGGRRERGADKRKHQERVDFEDALRSELAAVRDHLGDSASTLDGLRDRFPAFKLWEILSQTEQKELLVQEFKPKAYARALTARKFAVGEEAIKKSRPILKRLRGMPSV